MQKSLVPEKIFSSQKHSYNKNKFLLCTRIVFSPDSDELVEMVRAQDGRVSGQVVEVVHDDGHEQVQHLNKLKPVFKKRAKTKQC